MLHILRIIFILISAIIGWHLGGLFSQQGGYYGLIIALALATTFSLLEIVFTRRYIAAVSVVMFGLVFGFIISFFFIQALFLLPWINELAQSTGPDPTPARFKEWLTFSITFLFSFMAIIAIIRSKDDFKFVIPFIQLSREEKGGKSLILDTSVIIDGRIAEISETNLIDTPIILPRFVLEELQSVADSSDKLKRARGRHGLDILNRIQKNEKLDIQINEARFPYISGADNKLIELAKHLSGRIMTTDFNLNKVARLHGIEIVNVNDLANALRQIVLPGESLEVKIVRPGEEPNQGVGYLNDGTMVVVEGGYNRMGHLVSLTVTSVLQTSAGKMIFGTLSGPPRR